VFNADGLLEIKHSTIADNATEFANSGSGVASLGTATTRTTLLSSIVAENRTTAAGVVPTDIDFVDAAFVNSFQSLGYNVVGSGNALPAFNTIVGNPISGVPDKTGILDARLDPLSIVSGVVSVHTLQNGSAAVNSGNPNFNPNSFAPPLTTDATGAARVQLGRIDVGAVESSTAAPPADFTGDLVVDGSDFLRWQQNVGAAGATQQQGDATGDGLVNSADLSEWKTQFGTGGSVSAAATPASASARAASPAMAFSAAPATDEPLAEPAIEPAAPQSPAPLAGLGTPRGQQGKSATEAKAAARAARSAAWDELYSRLAARPAVGAGVSESTLGEVAQGRLKSTGHADEIILSLDEEVFASLGGDV
jgi:hypothetical protein